MNRTIAIALLSLTACAGSDFVEERGSGQSNIIGGELTSERPEIGALMRSRSGSGARTSAICTATLVSPRVILTAAHCVDYASRDLTVAGTSDAYTFYIQSADGGRKSFGVAEVISYSKTLGRDDVALGRLAWAVKDEIATPRAISVEDPGDDSGESVTMFGYGCGTYAWTWSADENVGKKQKLSGELGSMTSVCPGDSGGPTLRDVDGSILRVSSARVNGNLLQRLGWQTAEANLFGDVVARRDELVAQISEWTAGAAPPDPSEEPADDVAARRRPLEQAPRASGQAARSGTGRPSQSR